MPPKKKGGGKAAKGGKAKGGGKKGKKKASEPEGPVEWKLTKERLAQVEAAMLPHSSIKNQVAADMEYLYSPFPNRSPFKHAALKSPEVAEKGRRTQ